MSTANHPARRSVKDEAVLRALMADHEVTQLAAYRWRPMNTRLAGSIHRLREEGHVIETELRRNDEGEKYARYRLVRLADEPESVDRRNPRGLRNGCLPGFGG